ncbi:hypothetical protein FHT15_000716 [Xanthomonas campestris]
MVLIVHLHIEQKTMCAMQRRQGRQEPGLQRVVVDGDGQRARMPGAAVAGKEIGNRFGLQHLHRLHAAQQALAGRSGAAGSLADHQYLAEPVFQCLDPLRNCRRRHRQPPRSGVEAAFLENGSECSQLRMQQIHGVRRD